MGFSLALDDFGMGYSSLGRVSSLSKLSSHLKLDALGEGVENATQESFFRNCGYRFAQGFHFAKPMAADDFTTWMGWPVE